MSSRVGTRYATTTRTAMDAEMDVRSLDFNMKPRRVVIHNLTNNVRIEWNESLPDAHAIKTGADGARSLVTSHGITPLGASPGLENQPGFRLGALADVNDTTTEDLLIEAWGE